MKFRIGTVYSRFFKTLTSQAVPLIGLMLLCSVIPSTLLHLTVLPSGAIGVPVVIDENLNVAVSVSSITQLLFQNLGLSALTIYLIYGYTTGKNDFGRALIIGLRLWFYFFTVIWLSALLSTIASIFLILPGLIIFLALMVAPQAYIHERKGIVNALKQSCRLTHNHRVEIFFLIIPLFLLFILIYIALNSILITTNSNPFTFFLNLITSDLISASMFVLSFSIYTTLREAKEGHAPDLTAAVFD